MYEQRFVISLFIKDGNRLYQDGRECKNHQFEIEKQLVTLCLVTVLKLCSI